MNLQLEQLSDHLNSSSQLEQLSEHSNSNLQQQEHSQSEQLSERSTSELSHSQSEQLSECSSSELVLCVLAATEQFRLDQKRPRLQAVALLGHLPGLDEVRMAVEANEPI